MNIVTSMSLLKAMEKAELIVLHPDTGIKMKNWASKGMSKVWYVDDYGINGYMGFTFRGLKFKLTYVSGCFLPYVEIIKR